MTPPVADDDRRPLDAVSRRALRGFAARLSAVAAFALLPWLLGLRSLAEAAAGLSLGFTLGATLAMLTAALHRDRAGRGSLNRWDEALAFNGAALLLHLLLR